MTIRPATLADVPTLTELHRLIAQTPGGIIRTPKEVTLAYITETLEACLANGLALVAEKDGRMVGDIHAHTPSVRAFRHLLSDLTIVVHPAEQGRGTGAALFGEFLRQVERDFTHILRVELFVRETNTRAVAFYERLGFRQQGRHENKILNAEGGLETPLEFAWFNPAFNLK
ncbi:MAG: GNAT family N-acetyltransferase [Cytophagales bacterium]|nr:MAG: GNAT family N-acetyltransferase [Cytophagales bacterium]